MKVLAVETSSARGSVALLEDDVVVAEKPLGAGSRHGRDLVPCAADVLGGVGGGVDLIAVSAGPGSYTGLRVGITFAKTFAVETGTPVAAVSSLDVIRENVAGRGPVCVAVDARLGEVYAALYDSAGRKVKDDFAAVPETVAAGLAPGTLVVGDALRRYRQAFSAAAAAVDDESLWWPRAAAVGRLGRIRFLECGGEDPRSLVPRYLRRAQAEVKWEQSRNVSGQR